MSISNLLQPNNFDIYANNVNTQNIDTVTINDLPYPPEPVLPVLVPNKVLRTNALATDIYWGDVPHGDANQVLVTNPAATGPAWSDSLDLPGNIAADGSLTIGSNASFGQSVAVTDTLTSNALTVTTNANVYGNVLAGAVYANTGEISDLTTDAITNATVISSNSIYVNGSATFNGSSTMNITSIAGLTTTAQTNVKNLNLTDYKLKLNNVSGTVGQILQYDASGNLTFGSLPSNANMFKVSRTLGLANVNTTTNIFNGTLGGVSSTSYGSPEATVNLTSGVVTLNSTNLYIISGTLTVDTHNAQGKLVFREVTSGTARFAQELDYIALSTTDQIINFSFYYKPLAAGLTYEMVMIPYGVAGTVNILAQDATYLTTNCVMYIERKF